MLVINVFMIGATFLINGPDNRQIAQNDGTHTFANHDGGCGYNSSLNLYAPNAIKLMSSCGIVKLDGLEDRIVQLPAARVCPMGKGIDMVSACMVANVHVHVHVYAHAHAHVHVHVHVQMHVQMHVNLRMHARAHVTSRASPLKRHARTDLRRGGSSTPEIFVAHDSCAKNR